jgi:enamine deaminase RidA (YjgF/YER057c/UK114 family)
MEGIKMINNQTVNLAIESSVQYINPVGLIKNPAFTQVVVSSGPVKTVHIGLQNAVDGSGKIIGKGNIAAQTEQVLKNIQVCLEAAGAKPEHLVRCNIYIQEGQALQPGFAVFQKWWGMRPNPPANSVMFIAGFTPPDFLIGMDAMAVVPL